MAASGFVFALCNAVLRGMASRQSAYQTLAMQYFATFLMFLPFMLHRGFAGCRPRNVAGVAARGALHWIGTTLFLIALAQITLAEVTAIGFTAPIFVMVGASLVLGERWRWERGLAALAGLGGVLLVMTPRLGDASGSAYSLLMVLATLIISVGYLMTKHLTHRDSPTTIVLWQCIVVFVCSVPMAIVHWKPAPVEVWIAATLAAGFNIAGQIGMAKAFAAADISASQPITYVNLLWACLLGWMFFDDPVYATTLAGGAIIVTATLWLARREASR